MKFRLKSGHIKPEKPQLPKPVAVYDGFAYVRVDKSNKGANVIKVPYVENPKQTSKEIVNKLLNGDDKRSMNNENYIVINGKKAELTEEQIKKLGIETGPKRNNPFGNLQDEDYYCIDSADEICPTKNVGLVADNIIYDNANHFNDEDFAYKVMLHQKLYRKLLKYAYDNNAEVTEKDLGCDNDNPKYFIYCELYHNTFHVDSEAHTITLGTVHFKEETVAEQAIKDVIKPFMKENPEFVW